jgi:hypothetical protein
MTKTIPMDTRARHKILSDSAPLKQNLKKTIGSLPLYPLQDADRLSRLGNAAQEVLAIWIIIYEQIQPDDTEAKLTG